MSHEKVNGFGESANRCPYCRGDLHDCLWHVRRGEYDVSGHKVATYECLKTTGVAFADPKPKDEPS